MDVLKIPTRAIEILQKNGVRTLLGSAGNYSRNRIINLIDENKWFYWCTVIRYLKQQYWYSAPAHPFKIIEINPTNVDNRVRGRSLSDRRGIPQRDGLGQIIGGNWDCEPITDLRRYEGLRQRFEEGKDWEETEYWQVFKERFEERDTVHGYSDLEQFKEIRCRYSDQLFDNIRQEGYRPNYERGHDLPSKDARQGKLHQSLEVLVAIGRNGEIYMKDGWHRFTIARALNLDNIPVHVVARHTEWQQVREEIHNTPPSELIPGLKEYIHHPDMKDIVSEEVVIEPYRLEDFLDRGSMTESLMRLSRSCLNKRWAVLHLPGRETENR